MLLALGEAALTALRLRKLHSQPDRSVALRPVLKRACVVLSSGRASWRCVVPAGEHLRRRREERVSGEAFRSWRDLTAW